MTLTGGVRKSTASSMAMSDKNDLSAVMVQVQAYDPKLGKAAPVTHGYGQDGKHANTRLSYSCFLCGRDFGSRSLGGHLPQCLKKWEMTEALLPVFDQRKHPIIPKELADPTDPTRILNFKNGMTEGILPTDPKEVDNFNRAMSELARKNWQSADMPAARGSRPGSSASATIALGVKSGQYSAEKESKRDSALARLAKFAFGGTMPSFSKRQMDADSTSDISWEKIPKAYVCYLCGQQFGAKSLGIHLHHCNRQRELHNLKLSHPRPVLPLPPKELADPENPVRLCAYQDGGIPEGVLPVDEAAIRDFNTRMTEYWRAGLPKCLHCKTVFLPEQLPEHQPTCTSAPKAAPVFAEPKQYQVPDVKQAQYPAVKSNATHPGKSHSRPSSRNTRLIQAQAILRIGGFRHYRCYLCEEKFPGNTLKAHCMECKRTWVKAEEVLPEGMRRLLPPPPPEMRLILTGQAELPVDPSDVAAFNAAMAAHWEATSMLRCHNCRGCFRPQTFVDFHDKKCMLSSCRSDDTTVSLGSPSPAVLTPPVTQEVPRPHIVPELMLSVIGSSSLRHKKPLAAGKEQPQQSKQKNVPSNKGHGESQTASTVKANPEDNLKQQSSNTLSSKKIRSAWAKGSSSSSKKHPVDAASTTKPAPSGRSASAADIKMGSNIHTAKPAPKPATANKVQAKAKIGAQASVKVDKSQSNRPASAACRPTANAGTSTPPLSAKLRPPTPKRDTAIQGSGDRISDRPDKSDQIWTVSSTGSGESKVYGGGSHMYACYLCGQHYHYHSYHMHIGQCIRKWEKAQNALEDPAERVPVPPAPQRLLLQSCLPTDANAVKIFNEEMRFHRERHAMRTCHDCSKSVSMLIWNRHRLHCQGIGAGAGADTPGKISSKSSAAAAARKPGLASRGRLAYTCYVCADSFNAAKYHPHVESCRKRFERDMARRGLTALPKPTLEHKRLPVQPDHVEAFNQRMLELHENIRTSQKISHSVGKHGILGGAVTAKEVLNEFMGQHGSHLSSHDSSPHDSFDGTLFTPLPTGPGMQKGEVMVSCRHCGRIVNEAELLMHATNCALCSLGGETPSKAGSRPGTHRSNRLSHRHSHRYSSRTNKDEPMLLVRAGGAASARRGGDDDKDSVSGRSRTPAASPSARPAEPTISEAAEPISKPPAAAEATGGSEVEKPRKGILSRFASFGKKLKRKITGKSKRDKGATAAITVTAV